MTNINSTGNHADFSIRPEHNIDNFETELPGSAKIEAQQMMEPMQKHLDALRSAWDQAKATGNNDLASDLAQQVRATNRTLNAARRVCETGSDPTIILQNLHNTLTDGDAQLDMAAGKALIKSVANLPSAGEDNIDNIAGTNDTGQSNAAGGTSSTAGSNGTDESGDVVWATRMMSYPDEAIAQFETDPEGFFSKLKDLNASDRQGVIMCLQNEMQANNQLQSTLSNFLKALHDTDKAIISNLRV